MFPGESVREITREACESSGICGVVCGITYTCVVFALLHAYQQSGANFVVYFTSVITTSGRVWGGGHKRLAYM